MSEPRQRWMDFVRGICIILVILVHATVPTREWAGLQFSGAFTTFNQFMDPFRMPMLMFLSGMLLVRSLGKSNRAYIIGKFHLIFWPFLLWSLVIYAAEDRLTWEFILKTPISAPSVLWYLWFLCAFYLIALVLIRLSVPLIPVIVLSSVGAAFLPSLLRMDRFAALFAFFLLGHYAATRLSAVRFNGTVALLGLAAAIVGGGISAASGSIKYNPVYIWVPLGLIVFILWGAKRYETTALATPIEWIGRNSIVFYVTHFPLMVFVARVTPSAGEWNGTAFYLFLVTCALTVGAVIQLLRERYRPFAALFDFRMLRASADRKLKLS